MRNFYVGLLFSAAMLSCNGDNKDTDTDVVVDVDTDADTDADADTDTDADADTSDTNTVSCADLFFDPTVPSVVSGTTADDDEMGSCGGDGEADSVISFIAPFTGEFGFVLDADFNSVLYALDACDGDEVDCLDVNGAGGEILITTLAQGEELLLVVDGGVGDFDIGAYEVMKAETVCDDGFDDDFDTFADCSDSECWADKVCAEDCTDGLDDNDNGPIDCDDPVCATDAACIEICDDGIDNNKDGDIDCEDVSCAKELLCQAQCPDIVSAGVLPETLVGDTIGDIDEVQLIGKKGSGDVFIEYTAPQAGDYLFDLVGSDFDAALAVLDGCGGTELAFGDDDLGVIPSVPVNLALGQTVIIAIDGGEKNAEGNFVLNINEVELSESDCTDGQDLDADGLVDCFDLDCVGDKACIEICDNGKDDNGNGLADCFDADYCGAEKICFEDCFDGKDNNGNGFADCFDRDYCGAEPLCNEDCTDGLDDNGNGLIDCDDEAACSEDPICDALCPDVIAGSKVGVSLMGNTLGNYDEADPSCSGGGYYGYKYGKYEPPGAGDDQIEWTAPASGTFVFDTVGSDFDTVLAISDTCGGKEIDCNDQWIGNQSQLVYKMGAGDTVIITVDGWLEQEGNYVLNIDELEISETVCNDGRDLDNDNLVDCADPDCVTAKECLEVCDDGIDDNGNGLIDCQDTVYCGKDAACQPTCPDITAAGTVPEEVVGNTVGVFNEESASCANFGSYYGKYYYKYYGKKYKIPDTSGGDRQIEYTATQTGSFVFDTLLSDFNTALSYSDTCGGKELDCNDNHAGTIQSQLVIDLNKGQTIILNVDGFGFDEGAFVLSVNELEPNETVCDDGLDTDNDGLIDCFDPDCDTEAACIEICDNNIDDNGVNGIDCQEAQCAKDPACLPDCPDETAAGTLPETINGETLGNFDELEPSCATLIGQDPYYKKVYKKYNKYYYNKYGNYIDFHTAGDHQIEYTAPQAGDYVFDTVGSAYDTALAIYDSCGGKELACNNDWIGQRSQVVVNLTKGQTVVVDVDGFLAAEGDFTLNIAELETNELVCDDGRDLDNDGDVDCFDKDCAKAPECKGFKGYKPYKTYTYTP